MNLKDAAARVDDLIHRLDKSSIGMTGKDKILSEERARDAKALQVVVGELERLSEKPATGGCGVCSVCGL